MPVESNHWRLPTQIGNVPDWTQVNWEADIQLAVDAKIDAFVLNSTCGDAIDQ